MVLGGDNKRKPVCLAVAGDDVFICTNGGTSPEHYFSCFVHVKTGAIVERSLAGTSVYTNRWEIAVLGSDHPPLTILNIRCLRSRMPKTPEYAGE